jgi:serine/threonine protein kinase
MQTPWKSTFEKETMIREHRKRETMLLRSRRLCGRLQDFEILKKVGKGAFGDVFLARRRKTGELLALKRIHKSKLENKNQVNIIILRKF